MRYRADIDGLRGIAVAIVVLYHLKIFPFRGGFIGVDIFFVISGFLITRLIYDGIRAQTFSLVDFYERRIRRIFPALFCMLIFSTLAGGAILLPPDMESFSSSVVATTLFVSNLFFSSRDGYFDGESEASPLLHTWSLAVEEQFYIVLPLFLLGMKGASKERIRACMIFVCAASLAWAEWLLDEKPSAAFYHAPGRAWELLLGALIALDSFPAITSRALREALSFLGLALIGAGTLLISSRTPFPGLYALVPCAGAALVIHAGSGGDSFARRLLSSRPLVSLGLVSYSLYLWHWPIVSFYETGAGTPTGFMEKLGLTVPIGIASWLSWCYVEQPFRERRDAMGRGLVFSASAGVMAASVIVGVALSMTDGWPSRFSKEVSRLASALEVDHEKLQREGSCFLTSDTPDFEDFDEERCLTESPTKRDYLLLGDSHAAHYWTGFSRMLSEVNFLQATATRCKPLLETEGSHYCVDLMRHVFQEFLKRRKPDAVIIAARWKESHLPSLLRTIEYVKRHTKAIFVIGPIVEYNDELPRLLVRSAMVKDDSLVERAKNSKQEKIDALFTRAFEGTIVRYLSPYKALCNEMTCKTVDASGEPLQFDYGHLTKAGSDYLVRYWIERGEIG